MNETSLTTKIWDKVGICASTLCLIHCLATPVLLIIFPASSLAKIQESLFHAVFAVIVLGSILLAVYPNCKKHGHKDILTFSILGVFCILASFIFHDHEASLETVFTIIGSMFLIIAHFKNMKVRHGKCINSKVSTCSHKHVEKKKIKAIL